MPSNKKRDLFFLLVNIKGIRSILTYFTDSFHKYLDNFFIFSLNFYAKQNIIEFFQNRRNFSR